MVIKKWCVPNKKIVLGLTVIATSVTGAAFAAGEVYSAADCNNACSVREKCTKISEVGVTEKYKCVA